MEDIKKIDSIKNEYIKQLRSLKSKSARDESCLFLVEGEKCVKEALLSGFEVESVLFVSGLADEFSGAECKKFLVSERIIEVLSDSKTPQGVIACVKKNGSEAVFEGLTVVLDGVSDPKNVGSIIRSADAAGAACVVMSFACADCFSMKAIRSSMGSIFHIPCVVCDIENYLKEFSKNGTVIGGHLKGTDAFEAKTNTCIVIGNESRGISDEITELCDQKYRIPIYGKAESLNAGVAAGIMLYKAAEDIRSHS